MAGRARLRPRRASPSRSFRSPQHRLGGRRALHRPRRQGHPRRAARCADRRPHAGRPARHRLRPAPDRSTPSARCSGRLLAIVFMALLADNFTRRVLDRGDPGLRRGRHHRAVRARAQAREACARGARRRCRAPSSRDSIPATGWWSASPASSRWRASARPSCSCARRSVGMPLALVPTVMVVMNMVYALRRLGRPARCPTGSAATGCSIAGFALADRGRSRAGVSAAALPR